MQINCLVRARVIQYHLPYTNIYEWHHEVTIQCNIMKVGITNLSDVAIESVYHNPLRHINPWYYFNAKSTLLFFSLKVIIIGSRHNNIVYLENHATQLRSQLKLLFLAN